MKSTWIIWIILLVILISIRKRRRIAVISHIMQSRKEKNSMLEFLDTFLQKDCIIYTVDGKEIMGNLLGISEKGNSILVRGNSGDNQVINLSYVTRLREYPVNKKGKKKSIVAD